ncbi:glucose 1-dehydrogenase [Rhizobium rhizogenes]|uniref:L-iditol 2-dehydrogenase n=1 Tax=Rhizobium rhizogenes TaxID=359 RepID=A0AA92BZY0_RHIRH|nr:glucose 1-dehydrogenase [Rhizobium rhizogenes]PVE50612.1 L-iditol 2-dehydrogenase [Rhizobium rhizogenes]PVE62387.1 L-iditol 2-dehydrogenase [Agrobacterium tumefaciens]PVE70570.1 L-iditol 2-dehydrogenase [Sphingomonas sp. TPD3009]
MTTKLAGKIVLVTGGAGGIGLACARACVENGAQVVVADIDRERVRDAAASIGGGAVSVAMDVGDATAVETTVSQLWANTGRIDVLINNAGIFDMSPVLEVKPADFDRLFKVNVQGAFFVMQAVARQMKADGKGGSIINMASQAGRQAEPASSVYAATKAAVISLTRSAAIALIKDGIRVNAIAPGVIETEMWDRIDDLYTRQYGVAAGGKRHQVGAAVPIGRMGTTDEIASVAVFLASADSKYMVGQTLNVDGGNILS